MRGHGDYLLRPIGSRIANALKEPYILVYNKIIWLKLVYWHMFHLYGSDGEFYIKLLVHVSSSRIFISCSGQPKNIFVSPYPTLFLRYGSVGRQINFAPNFEKVGSILVSACAFVRSSFRPFKKKFKLGF